MAARYAVATGNWSNTATWDGGTLPGPGDTVRPNGFTVTINQDISVLELRNDASAPAAEGGKFLTTGTRIITADLRPWASAVILLQTADSSTTTVTGTIYGNANGGGSGATRTLVTGASSTVTINGSVTGATAAAASTMLVGQGSTVTITGNLTGPTAGAASTVLTSQSSVVNVTGDVTAGSSSSSTTLTLALAVVATIVGNVTGGSGNSASAIRSWSVNDWTLSITGAVSGGAGVNAFGIDVNSGSGMTVTINGNVSGGTTAGNNSHGVSVVSSTNASLTVNGNVSASAWVDYGIYLQNLTTSTIDVTGDLSVTGFASDTSAIYHNGGLTCELTITGDLGAGVNAGMSSLQVVSSTVTIIGDVSMGPAPNRVAPIWFPSGTGSKVDINGHLIATAGATTAHSIFAFSNTSYNNMAQLRLGGTADFHTLNNVKWGIVLINSTAGFVVEFRNDDDWPTSLGSTPSYLTKYPVGLPDPDDVREGTTYGAGGTNTGTLAVPDVGLVVTGTPVDDTVGTAVLGGVDPALVWTVPLDDLTEGIGARLKNAATVETTGAQLAAALDDPA